MPSTTMTETTSCRSLPAELDVKVSLHPAQASQRPCDGPVSSHTTCWLHDTVEKSMPSWGREHQWNEQLPFATPSVSIPPWFSCRDTVGKSPRLRDGGCIPITGANPNTPHSRAAFAFSHPSTRTAVGWPDGFPPSRGRGNTGLPRSARLTRRG